MMSAGEPGPFLPRGPASMMDYPFGLGQDGMGFNQPGGMQGMQGTQNQNTQNNQADNSRAEGLGFLDSQTSNQGNSITNRESNW